MQRKKINSLSWFSWSQKTVYIIHTVNSSSASERKELTMTKWRWWQQQWWWRRWWSILVLNLCWAALHGLAFRICDNAFCSVNYVVHWMFRCLFSLQVKLLTKELELAKAAHETNGKEMRNVRSTHQELEKQLKRREWEMEEIKALRDVRSVHSSRVTLCPFICFDSNLNVLFQKIFFNTIM